MNMMKAFEKVCSLNHIFSGDLAYLACKNASSSSFTKVGLRWV